MSTTTDLARRTDEPQTLATGFAISLDSLRQQVHDLQLFKRDIMVAGEDYGVIPGTPKPTLLKPGAEKLAVAFGLSPIFTVSNKIEDWEHGFFHYELTCDLFSKRTGERVANAIGSCNSKEGRYRWRDARPVCLSCGRELRRSKLRPGETGDPGWYCWAKMGGCGATFLSAQVAVVGRIENPEPYELVNTLQKMAQKRALVAAVLVATGGSGIWTQDVEDLPHIADEPMVIEQAPPPAPPPAEPILIRSADSVAWKSWLDLAAKAAGLNVPYPRVTLPISRDDLGEYWRTLSRAVREREAELARIDEDRAPASPSGEHQAADDEVDDVAAGHVAITDPSSAVSDALQRNTNLWTEARDLGCRQIGRYNAQQDWELVAIEAANGELAARILQRRGESATPVLAGQEAAF